MAKGYIRSVDVLGDEIVFVAQDDLWLTTLTGGRAVRLTNDNAEAKNPRFSPDGTRIAWSSLRCEGAETFVMDRDSGQVTRLTYDGGGLRSNYVSGWLDNDHLALVSTKDCANSDPLIYSVDLQGNKTALPYGFCSGLAKHSSDVTLVSTFCSHSSADWKRYRGGTAGKLWLHHSDGEWTRVLAEEEAGCYDVGVHQDRFIFTSDMGNIAQLPQAQLYSVALDGSDLQQHTHHTDEQGYVKGARSDGQTIVYTSRGLLYAKTGLDGEERLIEVELPAIDTQKYLSSGVIQDAVPDFTGDLSIVNWQGAIHAVTHRSGPSRVLAEDSSLRYRHAIVLGNTGKVAWIKDDGLQDCLQIAPIDGLGEAETVVAGQDQLGYVLGMAANDAGTKVVLSSHDNSVKLVDLESKQVTVVQSGGDGEPRDFAFSPDGRYLVWSSQVETYERKLVVYDTQNPGPVEDLTCGIYTDFSPSFTRDGKYLCFLSDRTFDPVYGGKEFTVDFAPGIRPYIVPLSATDPVPFGIAADGWPINADKSSSGAEKPSSKEDESDSEQSKDAEKSESETNAEGAQSGSELQIAGFESRMMPLPVCAGDYRYLRCAHQGVLWMSYPVGMGDMNLSALGAEAPDSKPVLYRYCFTSRKTDLIAEEVEEYAVSGDGKRMVVCGKGSICAMPADRRVDPDDSAFVDVDLSRLRRQVDVRKQWQLMLRETHHFMSLMFWREDMDGINWERIRTLYEPLVARLGCNSDLRDLLYEMVGELNTSHAYIFAQTNGDKDRKAAFLGADGHEVAQGWQIDKVLPTESSDLRSRSPLAAPGVDARPGDVIVAVDGRKLAGRSLGEALQGSAGKVVELTIRRDIDRRVAVIPISDQYHLRYQAWVNSRKAYVEAKTGGRMGYVHVPDMGYDGWAMFNRDFGVAATKEAMIVDMRFNGGGNVSQLIVERLSRVVTAWELPRHHKAWTYPVRAPRGPFAVLVNSCSGSDGDIGPSQIQGRKLAPIIGERTWGGVVGIDGRLTLVDGTRVTQPRFNTYTTSVGWSLENHGVDPDITVPLTPADWAAIRGADSDGVDLQLDAAIAYLEGELAVREPVQAPELPPARWSH